MFCCSVPDCFAVLRMLLVLKLSYDSIICWLIRYRRNISLGEAELGTSAAVVPSLHCSSVGCLPGWVAVAFVVARLGAGAGLSCHTGSSGWSTGVGVIWMMEIVSAGTLLEAAPVPLSVQPFLPAMPTSGQPPLSSTHVFTDAPSCTTPSPSLSPVCCIL